MNGDDPNIDRRDDALGGLSGNGADHGAPKEDLLGAGDGEASAESHANHASHDEEVGEDVVEERGKAKPFYESPRILDSLDEPQAPPVMSWYAIKVQSNREDSIKDAIVRNIKIKGLERQIGEIIVPTEKLYETKGGKKRVTLKKLFPGYIMIFLELNNDVWSAIREVPGVGDFLGSGGKPVAMTEEDVAKMIGHKEEVDAAPPRLKINFQKGDRVKINEGTFENFEGDVDELYEGKGIVKVMIQIFGRPTPVEVHYWQVEPV